ncbi:MAG TPA: hypothetical protein VIE65_12965 [Methylobacter sp.]|jgi:hypothetical protein
MSKELSVNSMSFDKITPTAIRDLKKAAKRLQKLTQAVIDCEMTLAQAQEITAKMMGFRDWHEALVRLKKENCLLAFKHDSVHELELLNDNFKSIK